MSILAALLAFLLLLGPLLVSFLAVLFPFRRDRAVGWEFWTLLVLFSGLMLLILILPWFGSLGPSAWLVSLPCLALLAGIWGNALWGRELGRKVSQASAEEERREAFRRIGRRMWIGLLMGYCLILFATFAVPAVATWKAKPVLAAAKARRARAALAALPTATSEVPSP